MKGKRLGRKALSLLLTLVMVLGMLPTGVLAAETVSTEPAWRDGEYVLELYNNSTSVTNSKLYDLLDDKWNTESKTIIGIGYGGFKYGGTQIKSNVVLGNAVLEHGTTYDVETCTISGSFGNRTESWSNAGSFTVEVYDVLTINTKLGSGDIVTEQHKVFRGESYDVVVADKSSEDYTIVTVSGAVSGDSAGTYTVSDLTGDATVNIDYKMPTDSAFVLGTVAEDVKVEVNSKELTSSGVAVEAGTSVSVAATASGDNKYVTSVVVKGSDGTTVTSDTTGKTVTVGVTANANAATTYTVSVTTDDAIKLSGTSVSVNQNKIADAEQAIKDMVTVCGEAVDASTLTIEYHMYDFFGEKWGPLAQSGALGDSNIGAYSFGDAETERIRIKWTDGEVEYTWQGTINTPSVTFSLKDGQTIFVNKNSAGDSIDGLKGALLSKIVPDYTNNPGDYTVILAGIGNYNLDGLSDSDRGLVAAMLGGESIKVQVTDNTQLLTGEVEVAVADSRYILTVNVNDLEIREEAEPTDPSVVAQVKEQITITYDDPQTEVDDKIAVALDDADVSIDYGGYTWPGNGGGEKNFTITVTVNNRAKYQDSKSDTAVLTVEDTTPSYTVTWDANGGAWGEGETAVSTQETSVYKDEAPVMYEQKPSKVGFSFAGWTLTEGTLTNGMAYSDLTYTAQWTTDRNGNTIEDGTAEDPFTYYVWVNKGEVVKTADWLVNETVPADPDIEDTLENGEKFTGWTEAYDEATRTYTYTAAWVADANNNDVDDTLETATITVVAPENGELIVTPADGATLTDNGDGTYTLLFKSEVEATKDVTVKSTPASGYYTDVSLNGEAMTEAEGQWKNTLVDWQLFGEDEYRNIYTGTFTVADDGTYTVSAVNTEHEWSLPVEEATIWTSGYLFSGWAVELTKVLDEVYGAGQYNAALYSGETEGFLGGIFSAKLNEPFTYKVTLKATNKEPAVSDTIILTVKDSRPTVAITANVETDTITAAEKPADLAEQIQSRFTVTVTDPKTGAVSYPTDVIHNYNGAWPDDGQKIENKTVTASVSAGQTYQNSASASFVLTLVDSTPLYTITWDANGGKWADGTNTATTTVAEGKPVAMYEQPSRTYYTFDSWKTEDALDANGNVTGNMTYTAVWTSIADADNDGIADEEDTFIVTWEYEKYDGTAVVTDTYTEDLPYGTAIKAPGADKVPAFYKVENVTYNRKGWEGLNDGMTVTAAVTFKAQYTTETLYTVEFETFEGSSVTSQPFTVVEGGEAQYVTKPAVDPTLDGQRFMGWYTDAAFTTEFDFANTPVTGDMTIYAKFIVDTNENDVPDGEETISVTVNGTGIVTVNGVTITDEVTSVVYDSKDAKTVTIVAKPNASYVVGLSVDGTAVELNYAADYSVTHEMTNVSGSHAVAVTFSDAKFDTVIEGESYHGILTFYHGMDTPTNEKVYKAVIEAPKYESGDVTVKYLAREAGNADVYIPAIEIPFIGKVGGTTIKIPLLARWENIDKTFEPVDVQREVDKAVAAIEAAIKAGDYSEAWNLFSNIATTLGNALADYNCHEFGANGDGSTEKLTVTYSGKEVKITDNTLVVKLMDDRQPTTMTASTATVKYNSYTNDDLLAAFAPVLSNGETVTAENVTFLDMTGVDVGTYTVTLRYKGNATHKPCTCDVTLVVEKAPCEIDYDSQVAVYGTPYEFKLVKNPEDVETIDFMIGIDIHDVAGNGVAPYVQLVVPGWIGAILGGSDGREMTLSDLKNGLNGLNNMGVPTAAVDALVKIIEKIETELNVSDMIIKIGGEMHPENIGLYLAGAVSVDSNYETAYTVDYLLVVPDAKEAKLKWNYDDENGVITQVVLENPDVLGASGFVADEFNAHVTDGIKYVVMLATVDANGEFVFDFQHLVGDEINTVKANGAYLQMAYFLEFGNEMYYAAPIVRPFLITPNLVNVKFVDANENNAWQKTFNNAPQGVDVIVTAADGTVLVDTAKNINSDKLTLTYTGIKTNTQVYETSTTPPTNAGLYAVTATYADNNEAGELKDFGGAVGVMAIVPAEATITVENEVVTYDGVAREFADYIEVDSVSGDPNIDVTVISAGVAVTGDFSENGWEDVTGNVNVDFPAWMDTLLKQYVPGMYEAPIPVSQFAEKVVNKMPAVLAKVQEKAAELGVELDAAKITDVFNTVMSKVQAIVDQLPENDNVTISFNDNATFKDIGAYAVVGIVTDSDHIPAADGGIFVVAPAVTTNYLKFNYEDANGIYTKYLLKQMMADPDDMLDMEASAYTDAEFSQFNETATALVKDVFLTVDKDMQIVVTDDWTKLTDGAYVQVSYIPLEAAANIQIADVIARPVVVTPNVMTLSFVNGNEQSFEHTGSAISMGDVKVIGPGGEEIQPKEGELTIRYQGVATNGTIHDSTTGPVHTGVYVVVASYLDDENNAGVCIGTLTIVPTDVALTVDVPMMVKYGENYEVNVTRDPETADAKYLMLTGGIDATTTSMDDLNIMDMDSILAAINVVNLDFPDKVDEIVIAVLNELNLNVPTLTVGDFATAIEEIRDLLLKLDYSSDDLDQIVEMLGKMDPDTLITFEDNYKPSNVGLYVMLPVVMDPDYKTNVNKDGMGMMMILPKSITATVKSASEDAPYEYTLGDVLPTDWTYSVPDGALVNGDELIVKEYVIKDADGNVVPEITEAGTYTVEAVFEENANYDVTVEPAKLTITEAEPVGATISGKITTYKDKPMSVVVHLMKGEEEVASVSTDENGEYSFENLEAGTYYIKVTKEYYVGRNVEVEITSADTTQNLKIYLKGDVNMDGNVNALDNQRLYEHLNGSKPITDIDQLAIADVNENGKVDALDNQRLYEHLNGSKLLK